MGRIDIILPDDLEQRLRMTAGARLGAKRGAFTQAILEGIEVWLDPDAERLVEKYRTKRESAKTTKRRRNH
jgi:hypothetical protein